jgi:hypothetical protein
MLINRFSEKVQCGISARKLPRETRALLKFQTEPSKGRVGLLTFKLLDASAKTAILGLQCVEVVA